LIVDGWSWPLIFSELSALYESGAPAGAGAGSPYRDYVAWLLARRVPMSAATNRPRLNLSAVFPLPNRS